MLNIESGIDSLTNFKRQTAEYLERLHKTGEPVVLTVNGKAQVCPRCGRLSKARRSGGQSRPRGNRRGHRAGPDVAAGRRSRPA